MECRAIKDGYILWQKHLKPLRWYNFKIVITGTILVCCRFFLLILIEIVLIW